MDSDFSTYWGNTEVCRTECVSETCEGPSICLKHIAKYPVSTGSVTRGWNAFRSQFNGRGQSLWEPLYTMRDSKRQRFLFFNVVLRPQRPYGLLRTRSPGWPPRLSHGSAALTSALIGVIRNDVVWNAAAFQTRLRDPHCFYDVHNVFQMSLMVITVPVGVICTVFQKSWSGSFFFLIDLMECHGIQMCEIRLKCISDKSDGLRIVLIGWFVRSVFQAVWWYAVCFRQDQNIQNVKTQAGRQADTHTVFRFRIIRQYKRVAQFQRKHPFEATHINRLIHDTKIHSVDGDYLWANVSARLTWMMSFCRFVCQFVCVTISLSISFCLTSWQSDENW